MIKTSITNRYIYITPFTKIINPSHDSPIQSFEGPLNNFQIQYYSSKLNEIQYILSNYNHQLTYIYFGKFPGDKCIKTRFLIRNDQGTIWWRKYDDGKEGSSKNWIYIKDQRFNLSQFLKNEKIQEKLKFT